MADINAALMTTQVVDKAVDTLYVEFKTMIAGQTITASNVVSIVVNLMQLVERYDTITGPQRKETIMRVLNKSLGDLYTPSDVKIIIDMTVPVMIDTFVSIDKKKVMIATENGLKRLFSCCLK